MIYITKYTKALQAGIVSTFHDFFKKYLICLWTYSDQVWLLIDLGWYEQVLNETQSTLSLNHSVQKINK